jgi:hypothetical protein
MTSTSSIVANTSHTAYLVKKAGFLSLPEELRSYVLSFLNCRDLLRCTSVSATELHLMIMLYHVMIVFHTDSNPLAGM